MTDKDSTYKVIVNGHVFFFTREQVQQMDVVATAANSFHLLHKHRSVNARIVYADATHKHLTIDIEGEKFTVVIKDSLNQLLEQMGWNAAAAKKVKEIKAPMPGLVLEVSVTEGQQVHDGDRIAILEAMKMENSLFIHVDAVIKKVLVKAGQAVEKGQVLVELE
jgi:Acetyl/propionyl-CoA carboxylase, alpha subunit